MANNGVCRCGRLMNSWVYPSVPTGYGTCNLCRYDLAGTCGYYCAHCNDYRTHSVCPATPAHVTGGVQVQQYYAGLHWPLPSHGQCPPFWPPVYPPPYPAQPPPLPPAPTTPPSRGPEGLTTRLVEAFIFGGIAEAGRDFVRLFHQNNGHHEPNQHAAAAAPDHGGASNDQQLGDDGGNDIE